MLALRVARAGMAAIMAYQDLMKILMTGQQPSQEQWEVAMQLVNRFTSLSAKVVHDHLASHPEELSTFDVN